MPPSNTQPPAPAALFAGLCTLDLAYLVTAFPLPNQKIAALHQHLSAGGPATNAAVTFTFLGGRSTLLTALGQHPLTQLIHHDLTSHAVALHDLAPLHAAAPALSSIAVLQATGERTVISANAAAYPHLSLTNQPLDLSNTALVLIDGHHLSLCRDLARLAHQRAIPVILDAGSWKPGLEDVLPYVHTAICSADFHPPAAASPAAALLAAGVRQFAITRGPRPILWHSASGQTGELPVPSIQPADTLGAGDIFHGAYCYAHALGAAFPNALHFAAAVATESCLHHGTRTWMQAVTPHTRADWNALLHARHP